MKTIGRYEIKSLISQSGFGTVYAALDEVLNRSVAIKVLRVGNNVDRERLLTSLSSATASALVHPGIAKIYGFGEHEGRSPYIVMEYLDGNSLEKRLREGVRMDLFEKLCVIVQIAEALRYAHQHKTTHGKLNPANVIVVQDSTAKIINLGIAGTLRDSTGKRNDLGRLIDEIAYKAPEQFLNDASDWRCDIFSFGVICYELLTGQHPFRPIGSRDMGRLLRNITSNDPPALRTLIQDCPVALDRIVAKALQKEAVNRYSSFDDLLAALNPVFSQIRSDLAEKDARLAEALLAAGKPEEARETLLKALREGGWDSFEGLCRKVRSEFETPALREELARQLLWGTKALASGEFLEASQAFQAAVRIDPLEISARPLLKRAQTLQSIRDRAAGLFRLAKKELEARDMATAKHLMEQCLAATNELFSDAQILYPPAEEIRGILETFRMNSGSS
jgi:serine/threonine protein kinase